MFDELRATEHAHGTLTYMTLTDTLGIWPGRFQGQEMVIVRNSRAQPTGLGFTDYVKGSIVTSARVVWERSGSQAYTLSYHASGGTMRKFVTFAAVSSSEFRIHFYAPKATTFAAQRRGLSPSDALTVFFTGRISPLKGHATLSSGTTSSPPTTQPTPTPLPATAPCDTSTSTPSTDLPPPTSNLDAWLNGTLSVPSSARFTTDRQPAAFGLVSQPEQGEFLYHGLFRGSVGLPADYFAIYPPSNGLGSYMFMVAKLESVRQSQGQVLLDVDVYSATGTSHQASLLVFDSKYSTPLFVVSGTQSLFGIGLTAKVVTDGDPAVLDRFTGQWIAAWIDLSTPFGENGEHPWYWQNFTHLSKAALQCSNDLASALGSGFQSDVSSVAFVQGEIQVAGP